MDIYTLLIKFNQINRPIIINQINLMCSMPFNYYVLYPLKLQLTIFFTYVIRFKHMIHHFNHLNLKICLIAFNCQSDNQKHLWFKTLIQVSCTLSVFGILICENPNLCQGQNVGSKMGCQQHQIKRHRNALEGITKKKKKKKKKEN